MQLKKLCGKSCRVYATHVLEETENETLRLMDFHVLQKFGMCFLMRFQGFLQRETLISLLNLCQEQHQFQDTLQDEYTEDARIEDATARVVGKKVYPAECVSLGSTSSVCKEERWYTQVVY